MNLSAVLARVNAGGFFVSGINDEIESSEPHPRHSRRPDLGGVGCLRRSGQRVRRPQVHGAAQPLPCRSHQHAGYDPET